MNGFVNVALALASQGLPVFPCRENKSPATPNGFKSATTDAAAVRDLWRHYPGPLIGVPTGIVSGFDVLDLDPRHGAAGWWKGHVHRLPDTRIHRTRSGGAHVLFHHAEPVRNTAGMLGAGVDTRGEGGYVIWWPAHECRVVDAPLATWPDWLLSRLRPRPKASRVPGGPFKPLDGDAAQRIAGRVLSRLASAAEGQRHYTLRKAAFTLGGLLEHLPFGESEAQQRLLRAVEQAGGADLVNAQKTAQWGIEMGKAKPFTIREKRP